MMFSNFKTFWNHHLCRKRLYDIELMSELQRLYDAGLMERLDYLTDTVLRREHKQELEF